MSLLWELFIAKYILNVVSRAVNTVTTVNFTKYTSFFLLDEPLKMYCLISK